MGSLWIVWLKFFLSAAVVVAGGVRLTRYADALSEKMNLSKAWVGMILLGLITSFPELAASLASTVLLRAPNLAVGNIAGSVNFNLMIIVLMDIIYRKGAITDQVKPSRTYDFSAEFFGILASIVVIEIFLAWHLGVLSFGHVSYGSILIVLVYILSVKTIFDSGERPSVEIKPIAQAIKDAKEPIIKLLISASVVVVGGIWLSGICDDIAQTTSLGRTFTGTVFLGFVTSLPEIVVSLSALKMGAFDLAFGNVLGSNIFNILILAICDIFYKSGPIFARVSSTHILIMAVSVLLTTILIIGIQSPKKKTIFGLGLDTILMLICFAMGMKFLYHLR
ncbi:MAG: hypothetical protein P9M07_08400 [Candidatus Aceula meridiana]|nr:hypothetical protein [Candidatus Aceula meridiana]